MREMSMRIAVLSDIHSNNVALNACIEYIDDNEVDGIIFLGDNISDCPDPQDTLSLIKQLDERYQTWHINGNREEYFIKHADGEEPFNRWTYSSEKGSLLYTYENLTKEDIECFRTRNNKEIVFINGTLPITIAHGSPGLTRELLYANQENTDKYLESLDTDYLLCGHSHKQFAYSKYGKLLINPGSVGVAIGVKEQAHMAMLEWNNEESVWKYQLLSIPYDFEKLCEIFYQSEIMEKAKLWPKLIMKSIETGINYAPICAKAAYDLAVQAGETVGWFGIPEKYWQEAARTILF
ncbi:putative phosphoesterase [Mobilisporobacter senegalensis]|uniref:Phosphoesterase n=2 Tax=Mobilisporobacter senegalensis TaxID=1329262 RepID=A0A3N1XKU9_9FIRM|nr:putative phosphoesterase [Mobilisporobacter senegalensis]